MPDRSLEDFGVRSTDPQKFGFNGKTRVGWIEEYTPLAVKAYAKRPGGLDAVRREQLRRDRAYATHSVTALGHPAKYKNCHVCRDLAAW